MAHRSSRHRARPIAVVAAAIAGRPNGPRCANVHYGQEAVLRWCLYQRAGYTTATDLWDTETALTRQTGRSPYTTASTATGQTEKRRARSHRRVGWGPTRSISGAPGVSFFRGVEPEDARACHTHVKSALFI